MAQNLTVVKEIESLKEVLVPVTYIDICVRGSVAKSYHFATLNIWVTYHFYKYSSISLMKDTGI